MNTGLPVADALTIDAPALHLQLQLPGLFFPHGPSFTPVTLIPAVMAERAVLPAKTPVIASVVSFSPLPAVASLLVVPEIPAVAGVAAVAPEIPSLPVVLSFISVSAFPAVSAIGLIFCHLVVLLP